MKVKIFLQLSLLCGTFSLAAQVAKMPTLGMQGELDLALTGLGGYVEE